jgi:hypothetical protein
MRDRDERLDRALRGRQRGIWLVTALIVIAGMAWLILANTNPERQRVQRVAQVELGADTVEVKRLLGEPDGRCPGGPPSQMRRSFPRGWPPAQVEEVLEQMREQTTHRWVYLGRGRPDACAPGGGDTEIGLSADHRVLWYVAALDRSPARVSPELVPER